MRVHILDPQLAAVEGRYRSYDTATAEALSRRGILGRIFCSFRSARHSLASSDDVLGAIEPVFSRDIFDEVGSDPQTWAVENYIKLNNDFFEELTRIDPRRFAPDDILFFPNILQNQINGLARWVSGIPQANRPTVAIKPSYLTHLMPYLSGRRNVEVVGHTLRHSIVSLTRDHPRTALLTDTPELAMALQAITGKGFTVAPLPLNAGARPRAARENGGFVCSYIGHASPLKGFHLLPEVVRACADAPMRFVIQSYGNEDLQRPVEQALGGISADKLRLVSGSVDDDAYRALIDEADIILLPYGKAFYEWASSGVLVEALSAGKVVVVPENTWLSREAARLGGGFETFTTQTPHAVVGALLGAMNTFESLDERAKSAAPRSSAYHSADHLVEVLLRAADAAQR